MYAILMLVSLEMMLQRSALPVGPSDLAHLTPRLYADESAVFSDRAATRYLKQKDLWHCKAWEPTDSTKPSACGVVNTGLGC